MSSEKSIPKHCHLSEFCSRCEHILQVLGEYNLFYLGHSRLLSVDVDMHGHLASDRHAGRQERVAAD